MSDPSSDGAGGGGGVSDTKSMLSDFYGMMLAEPGAEGETQEDPLHALGIYEQKEEEPEEEKPPRVDENLDLDSERFQPQLYVDSLLRVSNMKELLEADNRLVSQKRSLDSDMQMLVYENYNKFISATDMIRKMKENVENMEEEMTHLLSNMTVISQSTSQIEQDLTPNRERVENLVGVSRLLKRLEFLFELPGRLNKSIELGAYEQAVKYFRVSVNILAQYAHLKSFADIKKESEEIIQKLKQQLKDTISESAASGSGTSVQIEKQLSNAAMLIDLLEPAPPLLAAIFQGRAEKMKADMQKCVESQALALKKQQQQLQKKKGTGAAGSKAIASSSTTTEDAANPFAESPDADTSSSRSTTTAVRRSSVSSVHSEKDDDESLENAADLISLLQDHFLTPFLMFTSSYEEIIIHPLEQQQSQTRKPNKIKADSLEKCRTALTQFTTELFTEYFQIMRKELLRKGSMQQQSTATPTTAYTTPVAMTAPACAAVIARFTQTVAAFYTSMTKIVNLVPKAKLADRVVEIIEHSIRHCVECVIEQVQVNIMELLLKLYNEVSAFDSLQHAYALIRAGAAEEAELAVGGSSTAAAQQHSGEDDQLRSSLPSSSTLSTQIRVALEEGVQLLVPLLNTKAYLPDTLGLSFGDLAHTHFYALLNSLCFLLTMRVVRKSEGPVFDPLPALPPPLQSIANNKKPTALFYLYLAQICLYLESKEFPVALRTLKKHFPLTSTQQKHNTHEASLPKLLARMKESGQLLLQKYVEVHGSIAQDIVGQQLGNLLIESTTATTTATSPKSGALLIQSCSPLVTHLHQLVLSVQVELAELFPRKKDDVHASSSSSSLASSSSSGSLSHSSSNLNNRSSASSMPMSGMSRDIARLFSVKVSTYAPVRMNRVDPVVGVLKISLKCWIETIRVRAVTARLLQQTEADVHAVRLELPAALHWERCNDEQKVLHALLEEVVNSTAERCNAGLHEALHSLTASQLTDVYEQYQQEQSPAQQTGNPFT